MIILNTTFHIDDAVHDAALDYLKSVYIPEAIKSGRVSQPRLRKIWTDSQDEGCSYSVQFSVSDIEALEIWDSETGKRLNASLVEKFAYRMAGFSTLLEEIDL